MIKVKGYHRPQDKADDREHERRAESSKTNNA